MFKEKGEEGKQKRRMSKGGVDEEAAALSPKSRLKFLCSYGGKILPRPTDGQLKYVGGETRILSVPRSVTFKGTTYLH